MRNHLYLVCGFNPSEKYEFASWDDDIPNIWKVIQNSMVPNVPNQQPDNIPSGKLT